MKIEKLSDNQIRCTLNKSDLASRQLKISELAYGSEKAKDLFRDMMQQASYELGFEAEDIPLMIEAIPVSTDCIVLVITKVEDPEELDTRFSKFAPALSNDEDDDEYEDDDYDFDYDNDSEIESIDASAAKHAGVNNGADEVINLFSKVKDYLNKSVDETNDRPVDDNSNFVPFNKSLKDSAQNPTKEEFDPSSKNQIPKEPASDLKVLEKETSVNVIRIFIFDTLNLVNNVARIISPMYSGHNSLYKDTENNLYYLVINKSDSTPTIFNKVCNVLSEYGSKKHYAYASQAFIEEHYETIIKNNAIQVLGTL